MLLLVSVAACTPLAVDRAPPQPDTEALISEAEKSGDLATAATEYLNLAEQSSGALRSAYFFRAATVLHSQARYEDADTAFAEINLQHLPSNESNEALLLMADIALINDDAQAALQQLDALNDEALTPRQRIRALNLKVMAYQLTENMLEKATVQLALDPFLKGKAQQNNRLALWETLMNLTPQQLDLFNPGQPPDEASGWFSLAYAFKAYEGNPDAIEVALEDWQRNYPNHPADISVYRQLIVKTTTIADDIQQIAILLPESGPIASAAAAVKQGIIAAHFSQGGAAQLKFYDVQTDQRTAQSNVVPVYQQAANDGAQVVIGPLDKTSVELLAKHTKLTVPVIALNRTEDNASYENLVQFGLAPEDDAIAAAHFARQRGYHRALVLGPRSPWGERVTEAFRQQWQQQGGEIVQFTKYNEREHDFSDLLMPMLGISNSNERNRRLRSILNRSVEFEPRRRQDVDFIFMVATPTKARQLIPQLQFHRAGQLPVIATSHAYTGVENAKEDIDLNNLIIMDIPWMISEEAQTDPAYTGIRRQAQDDFGRFMRLAAMGADAYRLIPELNTLRRSPENSYLGATGVLTVNRQGQVERAVSQATFKNGLIQALPDSVE